MSKAFTKEDDDAGVTVTSSPSFVVPRGTFRLTARGAEVLGKLDDARVRQALAHAEVLPRLPAELERAVLGATIVVTDEDGAELRYRLVTPEEQGLLGEGCSIQSPIGRALLGTEVGETRGVRTPRGAMELTVVAVLSESGDA